MPPKGWKKSKVALFQQTILTCDSLERFELFGAQIKIGSIAINLRLNCSSV